MSTPLPAHEWDDAGHRAEIHEAADAFWHGYEYDDSVQRKNRNTGRLKKLQRLCAGATTRREWHEQRLRQGIGKVA